MICTNINIWSDFIGGAVFIEANDIYLSFNVEYLDFIDQVDTSLDLFYL